MKPAEKRTLVPKLRFPEFLDEGEWEEKKLGQVATFFKGKGLPKSAITPNGMNSCIHYGELFTEYSEDIQTVKNRTDIDDNYFLSIENDVLMPTSDVTPSGLAKACCIKLSDVILGGDILVIRTNKERIIGGFLARYIRHLEQKVLQLVSGSTVFHLYATSISTLNLFFPQKQEQQKIADCLFSLDELVTLETQKLFTLKTHKKGLMQQLFPTKDETLPKLRFPEFLDTGEWKNRMLGMLANKVGSGITPKGGDINYKTEGRPFVRSQNVGWGELILDDVVFIDEETHKVFDSTEIKVADVLLNITGASIGRSALADSRIAGGNVNQHVCIIRVQKDELNPALLNHFLISERGQQQIDSFQAGGNRQGLNFAQIRSFEIPLPPTENEQRKVSDCLASIDWLINAQTKKLETLKIHKKGLMQELFPALDEVQR